MFRFGQPVDRTILEEDLIKARRTVEDRWFFWWPPPDRACYTRTRHRDRVVARLLILSQNNVKHTINYLILNLQCILQRNSCPFILSAELHLMSATSIRSFVDRDHEPYNCEDTLPAKKAHRLFIVSSLHDTQLTNAFNVLNSQEAIVIDQVWLWHRRAD
jgi:hypothetical protein